MSRTIKAALGSVAIAVVVLLLKVAAWWLTGSVALYSDALESIINIVASIAAVIALSVSAKPADANHPYGHHKAEYLSAVLEGVLIVLASLSILREAYYDWFAPKTLDAPVLGLAVNLLATAINLGWAVFLTRLGRRWRSPALSADGKHLMADVFTSVGVIVGVALVALTGWTRLDPALAAIVALNILWTGYSLVRTSVGGLMDEAPDPEVTARLRELVAVHANGAIEAHDFRTRSAGRVTFVEFHLVVPGSMAVSDAHLICDRIEAAIRRETGEAVITIHVEPPEKAKHQGVLVLS
ncbi:cation diffusion facilitator family transporter [Faunimonas pinastri]|uniref:Cation diffusion facilitator family transporter n=1 Tax=Faunimonas pinastri TaxID=1855383 RepID=A0A1H9A0Y5_9HYPH|nr:cation diffusion facilitator family transporter [Faunimonas pinastri]SEP70161.1 cation diffusion facilitator family transporter [Faunimonas pinastri]